MAVAGPRAPAADQVAGRVAPVVVVAPAAVAEVVEPEEVAADVAVVVDVVDSRLSILMSITVLVTY